MKKPKRVSFKVAQRMEYHAYNRGLADGFVQAMDKVKEKLLEPVYGMKVETPWRKFP